MIARPLSGRPAGAKAYKLPMTDLRGWKPVSLTDDDEHDDEDEGEDDDE